MRPGLLLLASSLALLPSLAEASPFARVLALQAPATTPAPTSSTAPPSSTSPAPPSTPATVTPTPTPAPTNPGLQPTSSRAPASKDQPEQQPQPEPPPKVETTPDPEPIAPPPPDPEKWNRHGIGIRSGITVVPTWAFRKYSQSLTNALCRGDNIPSGKLGDGLARVGGCNFYVGLEYVYRRSQNFEIVPAVAYHRLKVPDGIWLDPDETENGNPKLGAADYTQINFSHVSLQVDFIGRGNLIKTADFKWQLGGGGGVGIGIITGGGYQQTPLGNPAGSYPANATCNTLDDFKDFTKCTPHYQDPDANGVPPPAQGSLALDDEVGGNLGRFAKCSKDGCSGSDLDALGRKKGVNLPVIPIINLLVTTRFLIKDTIGINITGGWQTGFYFGGGLQYFFGLK